MSIPLVTLDERVKKRVSWSRYIVMLNAARPSPAGWATACRERGCACRERFLACAATESLRQARPGALVFNLGERAFETLLNPLVIVLQALDEEAVRLELRAEGLCRYGAVHPVGQARRSPVGRRPHLPRAPPAKETPPLLRRTSTLPTAVRAL